MENIVRKALANYGFYKAEAMIRDQMEDLAHDPTCLKELMILDTKLTVIMCWFKLLNEDEHFVVLEHLVNGLDWKRVVKKYCDKWGELGKSESTLKRFEVNALQKIIAFSKEHGDVINSLFEGIEKEGMLSGETLIGCDES